MNKSLNQLYSDGATPVDSPSSTPSYRRNKQRPQSGKKWIDVFSNDASSEEDLAMQELNFDMDDLQEPASKQKVKWNNILCDKIGKVYIYLLLFKWIEENLVLTRLYCVTWKFA